MSTVLDNRIETHEGPEPRMLTEDVRAVLRTQIRPESKDSGTAVAQIAARAGVSPRTVYRQLNPNEGKETMSLDLGDRLCLACGLHPAMAGVRLMHSNGQVTPYVYHDSDLVA